MFVNLSFNASISELSLDRNKIRPGENHFNDLDSMSVFFSVNQCVKNVSLAHCDLGDEGIH